MSPRLRVKADTSFNFALFCCAQLSSELASLAEQLAARESELAELKLMKVVPAQNGLPENDTHKASLSFCYHSSTAVTS